MVVGYLFLLAVAPPAKVLPFVVRVLSGLSLIHAGKGSCRSGKVGGARVVAGRSSCRL